MDLARFLVELPPPAGGPDQVPRDLAAVRRRIEARAAAGIPVRVLRSVYVPEDDAWFLLVEAPATADVAALLTAPGGPAAPSRLTATPVLRPAPAPGEDPWTS